MALNFSPLRVSTTTVIGSLGCSVNILDVAKYLPLDTVLIGLKLVYARGSSTIIRGVAKFPKGQNKHKNRDGYLKDFYNQVTCTLRVPATDSGQKDTLVSCKVFHNGTLHLTGGRSRAEATLAANLLFARLIAFSGAKTVSLTPSYPYLRSRDNIIYATDGSVVGWSTPGTSTRKSTEMTHIRADYVCLEMITKVTGLATLLGNLVSDQLVFVSDKWQNGEKTVYTLNGTCLGTLRLCFDTEVSKRQFEVVFGYIYSRDKIIGKEQFIANTDNVQDIVHILNSEQQERWYLQQHGVVVRCFTGLPPKDHRDSDLNLPEDRFTVHMINTFFQAPFRIDRGRLHQCFLDNGLYSRLEPCDNSAVNLRYHHNEGTHNDPRKRGRCTETNKQACTCKDISVSCFNSGKMNVAGLADMRQGMIVHEFLQEFFSQHRVEIETGCYRQNQQDLSKPDF